MNAGEIDQLLSAMLQVSDGVSDLLFVVGRAPQVEDYGKLKPFEMAFPDSQLTPPHVESIAKHLMNGNDRLHSDLLNTGSCDCSYSVPGIARLRVNIFKQAGNHAIVMRKLQTKIPTMEQLKLPDAFKEAIKEKNGIIFVTGATGSGKTTTLAAMLNEINQHNDFHVVTLEDPIEFMHPHLRCTFSQREMGRDFSTFSVGLRAALRQAPKVILVGEIRDRDTMEIALTAAETGHVVYSTLHTISASQSINRIIGMFDKDEEQQVRERLADSLRYIISQRLAAKIGGGRVLITEMLGSSMRSREAVLLGESDARNLHEIIESSNTSGWHSFEQSLIRAYRNGFITEETAVIYSVNKSKMRKELDQAKKQMGVAEEMSTESLRLQHT
jgi:twitching motility protein PilT